MVKNISDSTFKEKISTGLCLVDFYADWCGPCRLISPYIEELSETFKDSLNCFKLNTDQNPDTVTNFNIRSIPTILIFKDGKIVDKHIGAEGLPFFIELVKKHK
jgi:thioredoxin 1